MSAIARVLPLLENAPPNPGSVVAGFDGFIDEMITLVAERQSLEEFKPVADIGSFGALVSAAAGRSSLREIVVNAIHPGGCAVNLGFGLAALGVPVDCFATLGEPRHPAFDGAAKQFRSVHSWGREPGRTLAFEFSDGKLMYSSVSQLQEFTAEDVRHRLQNDAFQTACAEARVIALTDWTLYPHMTSVWQLLLQEVFSQLQHQPNFFFDLVDPSSRSANDIRAMLKILPTFKPCGPVTLGLNGNEANILARLTGLREAPPHRDDVLQLARDLRTRLQLTTIVIHCNNFAVAAGDDDDAAVDSPHCARPVKSTGAGDRFNAGHIFGLLLNGELEQCITLGCATAGLFVRTAESPTRETLTEFLHAWDAGLQENTPFKKSA